jgi:hypothetical protein
MVRSQGSANDLVEYARKTLDDRIDYYGTLTSREDVLKDKQRYATRWPSRAYRLRFDTIHTSCDESKSTCQISGQLDFDLSNPATGRKSAGTSSFEYGVRFGPDGSRTFYEAGKILTTQK